MFGLSMYFLIRLAAFLNLEMTLAALKACNTGVMWEIYEPTPLTREYLIKEGYMNEWESILQASGIKQEYLNKYKIIKMKLKWFFPLGLIVSFLSGLIGATGPIHNPFMINYGITKEYLIGTKAVNSLSMQITKLIFLRNGQKPYVNLEY